MEALGQKITAIRKRKGLSQEELSSEAGINLRTLQRIEKGASEPRGYTLKSICQALGIDVEEVHDYSKESNSSVLLVLHASALLFLLIPLGNIIFPFFIWMAQKSKVLQVYEQGIAILNFQLTWSLVAYPVAGLFAISKMMHFPGSTYWFVGYIVLNILNVVYTLAACFYTYKGKIRNVYPVAIRFIKK